jgi:tRNA A37 threonylcarbamoyltransferase TsaD
VRQGIWVIKEIVLAGGLIRKQRSAHEYEKHLREKRLELFMPELSLCGDNAAMVGSQGYYEFLMETRPTCRSMQGHRWKSNKLYFSNPSNFNCTASMKVFFLKQEFIFKDI